MRRLPLALLTVMVTLGLVPAGAQAAGLYVLSASGLANPATSITGLISLSDGGGEFRSATTSGNAIAGTGVGPIVAGSGAVKQFSGGAYHTLATGVGTITSLTVTGRGLVVAKGNKLQYLIGGHLTDVPHGTLTSDGPWVSITTQPDGHLLGWAWNNGWGSLYELNLGTGITTHQDYTGQTNDPFFNNRDNGFLYAPGPVANSGQISADGKGGTWLAGAGDIDHFGAGQIYYAPPGSLSFNSVAVHYDHAHISATGDGKAYASTSDYSALPYLSDVYKFTPGETKITKSTGKLTNSELFGLAVDRCYTACSVSSPPVVGKPTLTAPKKKVKLGKKGLKLKLKCSAACSITITGKLAFGKAKASASVSNKIKKGKFTLKKGKSKTVTVKLSKKQRKKVKKALHNKRKVVAKLKLVVKSTGLKTLTKHLKLKVKK